MAAINVAVPVKSHDPLQNDVKLFSRWSFDEVTIRSARTLPASCTGTLRPNLVYSARKMAYNEKELNEIREWWANFFRRK